ncbi:helix-turn-helix domain-containing protein [Dermacoccaceae bacterium W4C1]
MHRNVSLFDFCRFHAYDAADAGRPVTVETLMSYLTPINASLEHLNWGKGPLAPRELECIARSVARWVNRRYRPGQSTGSKSAQLLGRYGGTSTQSNPELRDAQDENRAKGRRARAVAAQLRIVEIHHLLGQGLTRSEICEYLDVSESTVKRARRSWERRGHPRTPDASRMTPPPDETAPAPSETLDTPVQHESINSSESASGTRDVRDVEIRHPKASGRRSDPRTSSSGAGESVESRSHRATRQS